LIRPDKITKTEIEQIQQRKKEKVDYGKKFYDEAVSLMRTGLLDQAVGKLHQLNSYPESKFFDEAERIVGEINMDRLLSKAPAPGKKEYIVQSGDSLTKIANVEKCTIGYIIHVNGRMGSTLQRGDQLIVCPLAFRIVVDLTNKTLTLRTESDKRFKEYSLVDYKRPANTPSIFDTEIRSLVISGGARSIRVGSQEYITARKELRCVRAGVALTSKTGDEEEDKYSTGIFLSREDIEELALVVRPGTKVFVRK
jgi:hypothetical protein